MNIWFLHCQNLSILGYIHCSFCLNPLIIHGDMKENVSGCFFLNTVYNIVFLFAWYIIMRFAITVCVLCVDRQVRWTAGTRLVYVCSWEGVGALEPGYGFTQRAHLPMASPCLMFFLPDLCDCWVSPFPYTEGVELWSNDWTWTLKCPFVFLCMCFRNSN